MVSTVSSTQPAPEVYPDLDPDFRDRLNVIYNDWHENKINFDEAVAAFEHLLQAAQASGSHTHQAGIYNMFGILNGYRGRYDESIRYFETARELYDGAGAVPRVVSIDLNLGETYRLRGNYPRARGYFQQAYEGGKRLNIVRTQTIARTNEGQLWIGTGDMEQARQVLEEAHKLSATPWGSPEDERDTRGRLDNICEIHHGLTLVYVALNQNDTAWKHALFAYEYAGKTQRPIRLGYANRALASAIAALGRSPDERFEDDPDLYFTAAIEHFRQVDAEAEIGKTLFAQGKALVRAGKKRSAGQLYQQAMTIFSKLGMAVDAAQAIEAQMEIL